MPRSSLKSVMKLIDSANKEIGVAQQFLIDLENSIEKNNANSRTKPSQTFKPSSMNCPRQMVYQVLGYDVEDTGESYQFVGICESGTDRHIRIQKAIEYLHEVGVDCEFVDVEEFVKSRGLTDLEIKEKSGMELKLYHKKFNMSFMCDGIIKYKSNYYIFEFKTETSDKFYNRKDVDPSHHNQATAYSIAFGLNNVLFVYENRNTLDKKAFLHTITEQDKEKLEMLIGYCQGYVDNNTIPPKPEEVQKKTCMYCAYKTKCMEDK